MTRADIRGITLTHPWAYCIAHLGKDIENRTWHPSRQGGQVGMFLAIHGGAKPTGQRALDQADDLAHVWNNLLTKEQRTALWRAVEPDVQINNGVTHADLIWERTVTPGIVAVARLAGVVRDSRSKWAVQGQYHWQLEDVVALPTVVPHRGAQGLWQIETAALEQLREIWRGLKP